MWCICQLFHSRVDIPHHLVLPPRHERPLTTPSEPRIFYFETVECGRRCLLTGVLGQRV